MKEKGGGGGYKKVVYKIILLLNSNNKVIESMCRLIERCTHMMKIISGKNESADFLDFFLIMLLR